MRGPPAEIPVVVPSIASTLTVNAVRIDSVLSVAISGRLNSSSRSPSIGTQMMPEQCRTMKPIVLGRHLLGGDDQVAFVLAILVVDDDDHVALGGWPRSRPRSSLTASLSPYSVTFRRSTYLARMSTSTFTSVPTSTRAEARDFEGVRDERDLERRSSDVHDGQRHPVQRDGALRDHVAEQVLVHLEPHQPGSLVVLDADHPCDPVDVALHEMTAQSVARAGPAAPG